MTGGAQDGGAAKWEFNPLDGSIYFRPDPLTKYVVAELQSSDDSYGHMIVDAVNSIRATPAPAGWQPIDSAPRDDTLILVWRQTTYSDDPFVVVRWEDDWWQVHDGKNDWALRGPDPTHWMPLPKSPEHS